MPSAWFRLRVHNAASPSLHGVREGPFPRFIATTGYCDSLSSISPHFVSFAWRYHRFVPCSSPLNETNKILRDSAGEKSQNPKGKRGFKTAEISWFHLAASLFRSP